MCFVWCIGVIVYFYCIFGGMVCREVVLVVDKLIWLVIVGDEVDLWVVELVMLVIVVVVG